MQFEPPASGTAQGLKGAIFAYNHSHRYVRDVMATAAGYTAAERALPHPRRHRAAHRGRLLIGGVRAGGAVGRVGLMALIQRQVLLLAAAGADWVDEATVVDGHLISARTPDDLGPWMKALLAALEG